MRFDSISGLISSPLVDLGVTDWIPVSRTDVVDFARVTRAPEWIHVDEPRARRESPFGTTVAHGYLTLSLATFFVTQLLQVDGLGLGVNYGLDRVRFPAPTRVGSRVRAAGALVSADAEPVGARTVVELVYECDAADKPVCVAQVVSLLLPGS